MSARKSLLAGATLIEVDPDDVEIGNRVGFYNEDFAVAIGQSMRAFGQRDPIKFRRDRKGKKPWLLVVGRHRLVGARLQGMKIWGIEVDGPPEEFENLEASENLERRKLPPIENAMFVHSFVDAARKRLAREHGEMKQQELAIKARWARVKAFEATAGQALEDEASDTSANLAGVYGWQESARDAMGMSEREVYRALALYRLLIAPFPELAQPLAGHKIVGSTAAQLKLITDVKDESQRRAVIEMLLANPDLSADVARAKVLDTVVPKRPQEAYEKAQDAIVNNWERLHHRTIQFIPTFANQLTGPQAIAMRKAVDNRIAELRESGALEGPNSEDTPPEKGKLVPAVAIRASVKPDYLVCLETGTRHLRLRPHLARLGMTPEQYLTRWQLPRDYPMTAPNEYERRRSHWISVVRGWAAKS